MSYEHIKKSHRSLSVLSSHGKFDGRVKGVHVSHELRKLLLPSDPHSTDVINVPDVEIGGGHGGAHLQLQLVHEQDSDSRAHLIPHRHPGRLPVKRIVKSEEVVV